MSDNDKEVLRGAELAMQGLFIVYLHSKDRTLRAKARETMEEFWAWKDRLDEQSAAPPVAEQ